MKEISGEQVATEGDSDQGINSNEDTEARREGYEHTENEQDVKEVTVKPLVTPVRTVAKPRQSRVVSTERKYNCDDCEAAYDTAGSLKRHKQAKHEGKTYNCDKCEAYFTDSTPLRLHKQSKHAGKTYNCDECDAVFNMSTNYLHV